MKSEFNFKNLLVPLVILLAFTGIGLWGYLSSGYLQPLIMFGYIGLSLVSDWVCMPACPGRRNHSAGG